MQLETLVAPASEEVCPGHKTQYSEEPSLYFPGLHGAHVYVAQCRRPWPAGHPRNAKHKK